MNGEKNTPNTSNVIQLYICIPPPNYFVKISIMFFFFFSFQNSCAPGYDQRRFTGLDSLSIWAPISNAWGECFVIFNSSASAPVRNIFPIYFFCPLESSSESFRDWGALFAHVKWWWDRGNSGVWCIIHHHLLPPLPVFWLESLFFIFIFKRLFNSWCWWLDRRGGTSTSQLNRFASLTWKIHHHRLGCVVASTCFLIGFSFS